MEGDDDPFYFLTRRFIPDIGGLVTTTDGNCGRLLSLHGKFTGDGTVQANFLPTVVASGPYASSLGSTC